VGFFPYARPEAIPGAAPRSLKLSRYLWGTDYHIILKGRLSRLLRAAQTRVPGLEGRVCVDTAPLLERQIAARAGLGWQGKHTLLIAGKDGSWGFLGVLLLDAELPPDPPFENDHCGSCTACLDVCPTSALEPFRLDPNRCMTSYTVETEGEPPADVAAAIATTGWAAGCDLCQEVCPWNRFARKASAADLRPRAMALDPDLLALAALTEVTWREAFRGSAVMRAGFPGFRRNLAVALGNTRDPGALPALRALAASGDPLVEEHARWGIRRIDMLDKL
jgi:epoxyqueuosine reductase